jgi:hypothetical protein
LEARSGADAVQMSFQQNRLKSNVSNVVDVTADAEEQVIIADSAANRFINNKNFLNEGGVWTDTAFNSGGNLMQVELKFASEEFFALIVREPELAQYFALGEQVVVVWKGTVYRITN